MQRCKSRRKQLLAHLDAALPSSRAKRLESHLQVCQTCQTELVRLQRLSEALQCLRSPERPEAYWGQQLARFRTRIRLLEEPQYRQPLWTWQWVLTHPVQALIPVLFLLGVAASQAMDLLGLNGHTIDLLGWWLVATLGP